MLRSGPVRLSDIFQEPRTGLHHDTAVARLLKSSFKFYSGRQTLGNPFTLDKNLTLTINPK